MSALGLFNKLRRDGNGGKELWACKIVVLVIHSLSMSIDMLSRCDAWVGREYCLLGCKITSSRSPSTFICGLIPQECSTLGLHGLDIHILSLGIVVLHRTLKHILER